MSFHYAGSLDNPLLPNMNFNAEYGSGLVTTKSTRAPDNPPVNSYNLFLAVLTLRPEIKPRLPRLRLFAYIGITLLISFTRSLGANINIGILISAIRVSIIFRVVLVRSASRS